MKQRGKNKMCHQLATVIRWRLPFDSHPANRAVRNQKDVATPALVVHAFSSPGPDIRRTLAGHSR